MSEKVVLPVIDWLLIGLDKTRLLKHLQKYYVPHDEEKKNLIVDVKLAQV